MSKPRKKTRESQNIRTWLRQRTSPFCFGVKTKAGSPAHCNKNHDILSHFQCLKSGWYGRRLSRLRNADMSDHFSGRKTFYFAADGRSATHEGLVNIDIDCHGAGCFEGAIAFAEHLKATKFPNLYYEVSTNGNGVHGYIVVQKGDLGDEGLNGALSILDRWLKAELSRGNWDVEAVEVKGHCPESGWGKQKFELRSYESGQLAKLPREALTRADELRGTTRIKVDELRRLPVSMAACESRASVGFEVGRATKRSTVSVSGNENWDKEGLVVTARDKENGTGETSVVSSVVEKKKSGSISGHHFGPEELAKLGTGYLSLAKELLVGKRLVARDRRVVTEEDVTVFLMLVDLFTSDMNADGSLPTARWRGMWKALHGAGDVTRAWCHHRFATIRNFITDQGWLSWDDESFVVGVLDDSGRFVPGRASRWKAGEELMEMLEAAGVGEAGVVSEAGSGEAVGVDEVNEKKKEEASFMGTTRLTPISTSLIPSRTTSRKLSQSTRQRQQPPIKDNRRRSRASSTTSASGSPSPGPDLRATARAITGWRRERTTLGSRPTPHDHRRQPTSTWGRGL